MCAFWGTEPRVSQGGPMMMSRSFLTGTLLQTGYLDVPRQAGPDALPSSILAEHAVQPAPAGHRPRSPGPAQQDHARHRRERAPRRGEGQLPGQEADGAADRADEA